MGGKYYNGNNFLKRDAKRYVQVGQRVIMLKFVQIKYINNTGNSHKATTSVKNWTEKKSQVLNSIEQTQITEKNIIETLERGKIKNSPWKVNLLKYGEPD